MTSALHRAVAGLTLCLWIPSGLAAPSPKRGWCRKGLAVLSRTVDAVQNRKARRLAAESEDHARVDETREWLAVFLSHHAPGPSLLELLTTKNEKERALIAGRLRSVDPTKGLTEPAARALIADLMELRYRTIYAYRGTAERRQTLIRAYVEELHTADHFVRGLEKEGLLRATTRAQRNLARAVHALRLGELALNAALVSHGMLPFLPEARPLRRRLRNDPARRPAFGGEPLAAIQRRMAEKHGRRGRLDLAYNRLRSQPAYHWAMAAQWIWMAWMQAWNDWDENEKNKVGHQIATSELEEAKQESRERIQTTAQAIDEAVASSDQGFAEFEDSELLSPELRRRLKARPRGPGLSKPPTAASELDAEAPEDRENTPY